MTKVLTAVGSTSSYAFPSNVGVSEDAYAVERSATDMLHAFVQSQSVAGIYKQTIKNLYRAMEECSSDDWDGYGARAIDVRSWEKALWFSQLLPSNVPVPDIYVDSDGEATFEWYIAPRQVFSVTVRENGELVYAGIFGANKTHGTEHLSDELPEVILENIYRVLAGGAYLAIA